MASTSEVGHAKNVANFQSLIEFVTGYGPNYNPSKTSLQLAALTALKADADASLSDVITKNAIYNTKVNERFAAFSSIKPLCTRLLNAFQATDAMPAAIDDIKGFNRKIQGKRVSTPPPITGVPPTSTISTSQLSYDQLIQHLAGLKAVLDAEPSYAPNETDLQIASLTTLLQTLTTKNTAVATAIASISNARIARNEVLYTNPDSLFTTAGEVKKYVKSIYGATSPQFSQVSGLKFHKPKL